MKAGTDLFTDPTIDWSIGTFDGARLQQMRAFKALPFQEKLAALEILNGRARQFSSDSNKERPAP